MAQLLVSFILFLLLCSPAWATTWYVRDGGGTSTQCTGQTDAVYTSGSAQPCAFAHPAWALGTSGGGSGVMSGGDKLVIHHLSDSGGQAQYMIGYGMPNAGSCSSGSPYSCTLNAPPAGTLNNETKIYSDNNTDPNPANWPQLWGTQNTYEVLNLNASYIDVEGFEITDHSAQGFRVGSSACNESYPNASLCGKDGIDGSNGNFYDWILKNLYIHGMSYYGIYAGGFNPSNGANSLTVQNVIIRANSFGGWNTDISGNHGGQTSYGSSSGILKFGDISSPGLFIQFNGCNEEYPITHTINNPASIPQCSDQNASGYGDGFASNSTGGDFYFYNSDFSHNTQDGLDLLYHISSPGSVHLYRTTAEGNVGQAYKIGSNIFTIENSKAIGNCQYFHTIGGITLDPTNPGNFSDCRASGSVIVQAPWPGSTTRIINSSIWGEDGTLIEQGENGSTENCNGTESLIVQNSILFGEPRVDGNGTNSGWYYCSGTDGNGSGACCTGGNKIIPVMTYSDVWNTKDAPVAGTGNINSNPQWKQGADMSPEPATNAFDMTLTSSSSAVRGVALSTATFEQGSMDYNNQRRPPWDMGAYIYGSYVDPGGTVSFQGVTINTKMTIGK